MAERTKRIFISDVHMGDDRSMGGDHPYCWFKNNVEPLAQFLDEQRAATDVKEVVILGDLFDNWIIPTNITPLTTFSNICSNSKNKPVIEGLKALAASSKLVYVPGNHDMSMHAVDIPQMKGLMQSIFPNVRIYIESNVPLGSYTPDTIIAEHGHRFALFNAPDIWTKPGKSFLPLGYFISRVVAYKVSQTGTAQSPRHIFIDFLKKFFKGGVDFIEDMFAAIARDAGLTPADKVNLNGIDGFPADEMLEKIGSDYRNIARNWMNTAGQINIATAIMGDLENLSLAAKDAYFNHSGARANIVIFGHTHVPLFDPHGLDPAENTSNHDPNEPWYNVYANCGAWVDDNEHGCTYVETEERPDKGRHYVRVMNYPAKTPMNEGFVAM